MDTQLLLEIISGQRKGVVASVTRFLLGLLTPIYRVGIFWVNSKYDRAARRRDGNIIRSVPIPVISVGNLTTGGTGKTPLVIWISRYLLSAGKQVAIVSRGYGISSSQEDAANDEAREMKNRIPTVPQLQDPDRYQMAHKAVTELNSQVVLLDDGFQHRRLHRDLDIVLIDAINPFGYDRLLPRGLLREPPASLGRADVVVVTRSNLVSDAFRKDLRGRIRRLNDQAPITETAATPKCWLGSDGVEYPLEQLDGRAVWGFCGIGNPQGFHETIVHFDFELRGWQTFPDHHHYTQTDLNRIATSARQQHAETLVCTHKDLVKIDCEQIQGLTIFALLIETRFLTGQPEFEDQLDRVIDHRRK